VTRKGAGTILPIGFAIMIIMLTIIAYMAPPQIEVQKEVHENFVDTLLYMTSIVNMASKLPGGSDEKAAFIDRSFVSLGMSLLEKGIFLTYTNFTMRLEEGGDNVVVLYTPSKGSSYFLGLLATNLSDLREGVGSFFGGSSFDEEDIECVPIKSFPGFIVLYSGSLEGSDGDYEEGS